MKSIAWFGEVDKDDIGLVGGKGANLGELTRAGIPVPSGFVVTSQAYFRFLEAAGLREKIAAVLKDLDVNDGAALQAASNSIKEMICAAEMPEDTATDIARAYRQMKGLPVAVRSSATAEDLAEASFAGQQSTFLNIAGESAVLRAVQECWASLFEGRAIFYRKEAGFDDLRVGIAVVVQYMVQSERSGVMFTLDPKQNNDTVIVIEAIYGLGEAIVSGAVTPDHFVVRKEGLGIAAQEIKAQRRQLIKRERAKIGEENNVWVDIGEEEQRQAKLSEQQVKDLAAIGKQVEKHYGRPQDIEWAFEGGKFYIVQSRPVTAVAATMAEEEDDGAEEMAPVLVRGAAASPGVAFGPAKVVRGPEDIDLVREGDILVASMTTPDYVPAMKRAAGIVTDEGGRLCHAAIVSRELGVPCVVGAENATSVLQTGHEITVDGSRGAVYDGQALVRLAWAEEWKRRRAAMANIQTRTKVYLNLAEPSLADVMARENVDGVGLLRAEFIVADYIKEHPRLCIDEGRPEDFTTKLAAGLRSFAQAFFPRPVVYRTTDFKTNEYRNLKGGEKYEFEEENPMIGYRGAARYIHDPEVFRLEVEAIKRVRAEFPNLWVMIPFVRTPDELAQVKGLMESFGLKRSEDFKLWMMAEVPSNVFSLDKFIDVGIDGISIGSNDLTQLTLGVDRDSAHFGKAYDERNDAVIKALEILVTGARRRGITVSICGQAPSDYPEITRKLVEWGATSLSINRDVIGKTRQIIAKVEAELDAEAAKAGAEQLSPAS
ncbi:MAG TPA: phosphoenolpyruvate synthase [Dehalococcoidia bacterium]|jgi:pyruvate,water dikinase|nr:phosphoenolpyruvate synthase [Dehalococcoidia bacterium]